MTGRVLEAVQILNSVYYTSHTISVCQECSKNIKDVNVSWSTFHSRPFNPRQYQLMTKSPSIHYWVFHRKRICFMGLKCFYRQHYCHSTLCIWNVSAPACNNNVLTNRHLLLNHSFKYCGCTSIGFMSMQLHCRSK